MDFKPEQDTVAQYQEVIVTHWTHMPTGYTFIPKAEIPSSRQTQFLLIHVKGDIHVTRHCRELTAASDQTLYVVRHKYTGVQQGLRCPTVISDKVEHDATLSVPGHEETVIAKDRSDIKKARDTLNSIFPRMPPAVVEAVIERAFSKGSGSRRRKPRILSSHDRTCLAVQAHVRHSCTEYDSLLSTWARAMSVEGTTTPVEKDEARRSARKHVRARIAGTLTGWLPKGLSKPQLKRELKDIMIFKPEAESSAEKSSRRFQMKTGIKTETGQGVNVRNKGKDHPNPNCKEGPKESSLKSHRNQTASSSRPPKRQAAIEAERTWRKNPKVEDCADDAMSITNEDNTNEDNTMTFANGDVICPQLGSFSQQSDKRPEKEHKVKKIHKSKQPRNAGPNVKGGPMRGVSATSMKETLQDRGNIKIDKASDVKALPLEEQLTFKASLADEVDAMNLD